MSRSARLVWVGSIPVLTSVAAMLALLVHPAAVSRASLRVRSEGPSTQVSSCVPGLRKWVEPGALPMGAHTNVTLVMTATCASAPVPIDLIMVVDESNSMRRYRGMPGEPTEPKPTEGTPGTIEPPTPPPPPIPGETPGGPGRGEPPFCRPEGIKTRTPSPTPTKWWQRGTPVDRPQPTPDIEELEPASNNDQIRAVRKFLKDFADADEVKLDLESDRLRVGFVSFSDRVRLKRRPSSDLGDYTSATNQLRGQPRVTRIRQGLRIAAQQLTGTGSREGQERIKAVFILSDFQFCDRDLRRAKLPSDVIVVSVGFNVRAYDAPKLVQMATSPQHVSERHKLSEVSKIYHDLLAGSRGVRVAELTVKDELASDIELIPGSVDPPTVTITGKLLEWQFADPSFPLTLTYRAEPQRYGLVPISEEAVAEWVDTEGLPGSGRFPDVDVECLAPTPTWTPTDTATPTATATHTPTATQVPGPVHLPILYRNWPAPTPAPSPTVCIPEEQTVDVALVIDTSTSMSEATQPGGVAKLQAAVEAAKELVRHLKTADQATVIGFNNQAHVATVLTSNKAALIAALDSLPATQARGTRIDLGLKAGRDELTSPRHVPGNNRTIVLVTDGMQSGGEGKKSVRDAAAASRAAGIRLIVVGLGSDVDEPLLREVVSRPEYYFRAPNAEDLLKIYRKIVDYIPCP